jgi:cytochrome P450
MVANVLSFFPAGADTISLSLRYLMLLMVEHPQVQAKVHQELDGVCGRGQLPTLDQKNQLPYTQAVISEMHRWTSFVPLSVTRMAGGDVQVGGYCIPRGSVIVANLHAIHHDPQVWSKPHEFNPDRFLSEDGKRFTKHEALIPFSIGKRSCPGEGLADMEVFLFFTAIMSHFSIHLPEGVDRASFDYSYGLVNSPHHTSFKLKLR